MEDDGLLLPLLKQPLQRGFAQAYTSVDQKGMRGGGVFQSRRLIGINAAHSHPLWPGRWMGMGNKPVKDSLNLRLEQVPLAIPLQTIRLRLKAAAVPRELPPLEKGVCQTPAQEGAGARS